MASRLIKRADGTWQREAIPFLDHHVATCLIGPCELCDELRKDQQGVSRGQAPLSAHGIRTGGRELDERMKHDCLSGGCEVRPDRPGEFVVVDVGPQYPEAVWAEVPKGYRAVVVRKHDQFGLDLDTVGVKFVQEPPHGKVPIPEK